MAWYGSEMLIRSGQTNNQQEGAGLGVRTKLTEAGYLFARIILHPNKLQEERRKLGPSKDPNWSEGNHPFP